MNPHKRANLVTWQVCSTHLKGATPDEMFSKEILMMATHARSLFLSNCFFTANIWQLEAAKALVTKCSPQPHPTNQVESRSTTAALLHRRALPLPAQVGQARPASRIHLCPGASSAA